MIITSKKKQTIDKQPVNKNIKIPETSKLLVLLALISVPATYITMIISSFITLGISLWALAIVLQLPRIPIFILVAIGVAPLVSLWAMFRAIKAMFFSKPEFQAAVTIKIADKPKLNEAIKEVCSKVKTQFPDTIIFHIEPTFFVTEGKLRTIDGIVNNRTLAIGAPLMRRLTINEFKAILAHEFAHFSGNDTAYSRFVVPVYKSINSAINDIAGINESNKSASNVINFMNLLLFMPVIFLKIFLMYFATIDNILSRSRELRADWIAATNFGDKNMATGLTKVVQISGHYRDFSENIGFNNENCLEKYDQLLIENLDKLDEYKQKALLDAEQVFDTHPTLSTRLMSLPDSNYESGQNTMEEIVNELSPDEKKLSDSYQKLVRDYAEYQQQMEKIRKEFDLINNTQSKIIQGIAEIAKKDLKLSDMDIKHAVACLLIGENIPSEHKRKTDKIIDLIKKNPRALDLLLKGTVIRISLLSRYGLNQNVEKIKTKYSELNLVFDSSLNAEVSTLDEYANNVNEFCGALKDTI
jgi:Zn-dependent protease with chaperone function